MSTSKFDRSLFIYSHVLKSVSVKHFCGETDPLDWIRAAVVLSYGLSFFLPFVPQVPIGV